MPLLLLEVLLGEVLHLASEHAPQRAPAACSERQPPEPLLLPSDHLPPPHHPLEHLRQAAFALTFILTLNLSFKRRSPRTLLAKL